MSCSLFSCSWGLRRLTNIYNLWPSLLPTIRSLLAMTMVVYTFRIRFSGLNVRLPVFCFTFCLSVSAHFDACGGVERSPHVFGVGAVNVIGMGTVWVPSEYITCIQQDGIACQIFYPLQIGQCSGKEDMAERFCLPSFRLLNLLCRVSHWHDLHRSNEDVQCQIQEADFLSFHVIITYSSSSDCCLFSSLQNMAGISCQPGVYSENGTMVFFTGRLLRLQNDRRLSFKDLLASFLFLWILQFLLILSQECMTKSRHIKYLNAPKW